VMLIIVAGYVGWWYLDQTRPDTEPGGAVAFTVLEADTLDSLTTRLVDEGFVVDESDPSGLDEAMRIAQEAARGS